MKCSSDGTRLMDIDIEIFIDLYNSEPERALSILTKFNNWNEGFDEELQNFIKLRQKIVDSKLIFSSFLEDLYSELEFEFDENVFVRFIDYLSIKLELNNGDILEVVDNLNNDFKNRDTYTIDRSIKNTEFYDLLKFLIFHKKVR